MPRQLDQVLDGSQCHHRSCPSRLACLGVMFYLIVFSRAMCCRIWSQSSLTQSGLIHLSFVVLLIKNVIAWSIKFQAFPPFCRRWRCCCGSRPSSSWRSWMRKLTSPTSTPPSPLAPPTPPSSLGRPSQMQRFQPSSAIGWSGEVSLMR